MTWCQRLAAALAVLLCSLAAAPAAQAADPPPLFAYYYIWFQTSSWNRAKIDYPKAGRYSSDEAAFMRQHIRLAKRSGIDGFLVSWKSTPLNDSRLALLIDVAEQERFKLGIVYQGLDFERNPLPTTKIAKDLDRLARIAAPSPAFDSFKKPVVIWSGTWKFSPEEIRGVTQSRRDKLLILATERQPKDYLDKARHFDGDAYYWSSVNPQTHPNYVEKLQAMSEAAHTNGGLWIAPAAPGFDARLVGGKSVVERRDGATLRAEMDAAAQSSPDAIGLISWNEFSENTHVEPSVKHGTRALEVLADVRGTTLELEGEFASDEPGGAASGFSGISLVIALVIVVLGGLFLIAMKRRSNAGA